MPKRAKADATMSVEWNKIRRRARNLLCRWARSTGSAGSGLRLVRGSDPKVPRKPKDSLPGKFPGAEPYPTRVRSYRKINRSKANLDRRGENAVPEIKLAVG